MTDIFSKEKRSEIMSKIRGKWTKPEKRFYEEHPEAVPHPKFPHSPDFLLDGKIVFLDSTFWHGYLPREKYERMTEYWRGKLFRTIVRDLCADAFYGHLDGILDRRLIA